MRIAYVSADLGVPIFGRKGCSIHAQEILAALLSRGAQVDLFTTAGDGPPVSGLEDIQIHLLPRPPKGDPAAREQAARSGNDALRTALESVAPFGLVYERYSLWSYTAMEFAREVGIPGILEVNAPLIEEQANYRVLVDRVGAQEVAGRAFGAASALLAVSAEVAAWLESFPAARGGKIHIVPNGIRPERFPAASIGRLPATPGVFTVGFVGTLKAWHGLSVLTEAFGLLHTRCARTRLLIVGDGPERETVAKDLAQRGLEEATLFTGAVPPTEIPALLASMDVAVAPYPPLPVFYFSPLKVYEYMAAGRAVVASELGQMQTLIRSEENGLLVKPGDANELAEALERLLKDPELCARLGRNARATVLRDHTWDSVAGRILDLAASSSARPADMQLARA